MLARFWTHIIGTRATAPAPEATAPDVTMTEPADQQSIDDAVRKAAADLGFEVVSVREYVLPTSEEQAEADEREAAREAAWAEREAKAAARRAAEEAQRAADDARVASGEGYPVIPYPCPDGMLPSEHGQRAASTLAHSQWYHRRTPYLNLQGREFGERLTATGWPWYHQLVGGDRFPYLTDAMPRTGVLADAPTPVSAMRSWDKDLSFEHWKKTTATLFLGYKGLWTAESDWERPEWADAFLRIAREAFGPIRFVRGRYDSRRVALILRMPEGVPTPRSRSIKLRTDEGSTQQVEIKGKGNSITLLGMHAGGAPYAWESAIPGFDGMSPDHVDVVTPEQVEAFVAALEAEFPVALHVPAPRTGAVEVELTSEGLLGLVSTVRATSDPAGAWDADDEGFIVRGRGPWLYHQACTLIWSNRGKLRDLVGPKGEDGEDDHERLKVAVSSVVATLRDDVDRLVRDGGKHSRESLHRDAPGTVGRAWARKWRNIADWEPTVRRRADGSRVLVIPPPAAPTSARAVREAGDEDLAGLLVDRTEGIKGVTITPPDPEVAATRARPVDRGPIEAHVAGTVDAAIQGFFDAAETDRDGLLILKAPTGSGKTSRLLAYLKALKAAGRLTRPVLVLQQNYGLIGESLERVEAADVPEDPDERKALEGKAAQARAAGLRAMVYEGKSRLCVLPSMKVLASRGIATGDLCSKEAPGQNDKYSRKKYEHCEHYEGCPAISQKHKVAQSDVVFLPSAYLTCKLPKELTENILAVVIDEAVHDQLLGEGIISFKDLGQDRRETMLTKKQRAAGDDADALRRDRQDAVALVREAVLAGEGHRIPEYLFDRPADDLARKPLDLVRAARRVVSDALRPVGVKPNMDGFQAEYAVKAPAGGLWAEWHFWDVVEDRMMALPNRRLWDAHGKEKGIPFPVGAARGDRDVRLQALDVDTDARGRLCIGPKTVVRVSYRRKPNWAGIPVLLLDASANPDVTRKLWPGRAVKVVDVAAEDARPHTRVMWCPEATYSDSTLLPYAAKEKGRLGAAMGLASLRALLSGVCAYYGQGQVLCCSTLAVEQALLTAWPGPRNLSTVHQGNLVGLDFAKDYQAHVIVGRQEPSIRAMDSRAGALSYDEPEPELPYDLLGTGKTDEGKELFYPTAVRTVAMLDGSDASVMVHSHPGKWGRRMQELSTLEGNAQAFGRARGVYKDGGGLPPLIVYLGRVPPQGVIVDALTTVADLVRVLHGYAQIRVDGGFVPTLAPGIGVTNIGGETDPTRVSDSVRGMLKRRLDALDHVAYVTSEGKPRTGRCLADLDAAALAAAVTAWEAAAGRGAPTGVHVSARGRDLPALSPRPLPAKMEAVVGTREQRAALRDAMLAAAGDRVTADTRAAVANGGRALAGYGVEAALVMLTVGRRASADAPAWKLPGAEAKPSKLAGTPAPAATTPAMVTQPPPEPVAPVDIDDPVAAALLAAFHGAELVAVRTLAPPDNDAEAA